MSLWFLRSLATVACVSGDFVVRLMIASRVHVMWSSHRRRISERSTTCFCVNAGAAPWAVASWPFETASAASALKKATSAVRAIGIGRAVLGRVHVRFLSVV